ncbi:hypothetical protein COCMIDRAFT_85310 [Bipolaris oryzae ATCC 44560]|uniref:Uncharacterized protein n=1 Tax=Bipolaris oryzae ATCC 44560 TaxID=930090 RepID=W6ZGQ6_COCMI|nr:uncharacterized protein COCMIDRAFT_85310 [Bipolaris oryzae ATCC 44560]EUC49210.1 hypothetical protein COCMIDRAFT_85310 [Bipolaris oryzae ATCC 44560]
MAPEQGDEEQERKHYEAMNMNGKLRPMAMRIGFRNVNRWNQRQLVTIFLEYDRINPIRARNIPKDHKTTPAEIEAQHALVDRLIKEKKLQVPVPKRKRENGTTTGNNKRVKISSGDDDHISPSDSGKSNDKRVPRHVSGTKGVSKTGSRSDGVQKKSKQTEKPAATKPAPTKPAPTKPAPTKPRSRQASTLKPRQKKTNMDVGNPQDAESQNPSAPAVDPPFVTPGANPGDDDDSSESDDSDSGDDNGDDVHDDEDIEERDEDFEAEEISKAPSKNQGAPKTTGTSKGKGKDTSEVKAKPLGLHLGVRKIDRYTSLDWDPLNESIPNSRLTWYEQEQRFRAQQEKTRKEAQEEEPKKEWDWKKQLRRKE